MTTLPTLKRGSSGLAVRELQTALLKAGYGNTIDGKFGPKVEEALKSFQRENHLQPDGIAGPNTWAALGVVAEAPAPVVKQDALPAGKHVDDRSESIIATLHPRLANPARQFVRAAAAKGITIRLISGLRTYAEQDALYAKGRTAGGSKVTNARAGDSWHNHGVAFDIGVFNGKEYIPESPHYMTLGPIGESCGFSWGGRWKSFKDYPHYELTNGKTIAQAKALHAKGKTVFDS